MLINNGPKNYNDDHMHPYIVNAYVLSPVEFLFGMKLSLEDTCKPHTSLLWKQRCHGNNNDI